MNIRPATEADLDAVERIYDAIHTQEEAGHAEIGWVRGVYPTRATAEAALRAGSLYILEDGGEIPAAAKIDQEQVEHYAQIPWTIPAADSEVLVLHTLVVSPAAARRGYGKAFVAFYEAEARRRGCRALRKGRQPHQQRQQYADHRQHHNTSVPHKSLPPIPRRKAPSRLFRIIILVLGEKVNRIFHKMPGKPP